MFDVIGKRRWFFLFSGLITIPGLIFILLTPITGGGAGLQFSIDYTGGTTWEIRFEDPNVSADQIKTVFVAQGIGDAEVLATSDGYYEIRTKTAALGTPPPADTPAPSVSASPSGSAGPSTSPGASSSAAPSASPSASPSRLAQPEPVAGRQRQPRSVRLGLAGRRRGRPPALRPGCGSETLPTTGKFGDIRKALEAALGPIARSAT